LLSGLGISLLALGSPGALLGVAVAVLLAAGYVMDSVDGQLARLRGGGSKSGEWLDHTIDCFKVSLLHLAVLVSWFRFPFYSSTAVLLVPIGFEVVAMATYFGLILMPTLRVAPAFGVPSVPLVENRWRKWLLLPLDYGVVCWSFLLLIWPPLFAAAYFFMFLASAGGLALALRKWWRELRVLDAAS
jgi:phosphatidylglycerophosphate synthase